MKLTFLLLCCVAISTWLQAASGRHLSRAYLRKLFAKDEYYHGSENENTKLSVKAEDLPKNGEIIEGDMIMDEGIRQAILGQQNKRTAVNSAKVGNPRHWPNGDVPYKLNKNLHPKVKKQIKKAIKEMAMYTCVKYVKKKDFHKDWVDFQDGKGCSSSVGRQGGEQKIHLAYGCKRIGTVLHEMMHAIGIIHEQSRPDRDEHVEVRFKHIKPDLMLNFNKYRLDEADNLDIPYNFFSVMHYSNYAFSKDDETTLVSKSDHSLKFGQRMQLTKLDIEQINRLYPCEKDVSPKQAAELIPNMTENDIEERKRDEQRELYEDWY